MWMRRAWPAAVVEGGDQGTDADEAHSPSRFVLDGMLSQGVYLETDGRITCLVPWRAATVYMRGNSEVVKPRIPKWAFDAKESTPGDGAIYMPPPSYPPTLNGVPLPPLPISDNDERVAAVAGISASAIEEKTEVEAGKAESKSSEPPQLPTPRPVPPNEAAMKLIKKAKKLISGGSIEPAKRLLKKIY